MSQTIVESVIAFCQEYKLISGQIVLCLFSEQDKIAQQNDIMTKAGAELNGDAYPTEICHDLYQRITETKGEILFIDFPIKRANLY